MEQLLAAVDLGSNSFRLSIGRVVQEDGITQIYSVDSLKETVRLAAGLNANRQLSEDAIERAVHVLQRFGERIRDFPASRVRAVATNTFRVAKNISDLHARAEAALGFPIEVVSGQEEARLVFSGVAHELPPSKEHRLVVDIGGGSTEFIIGKGLAPKLMQSLPMGCVSYTKRFFANGQVSAEAFAQAELAACKELEAMSKPYRKLGWAQAFGSSGTARAILAVLRAEDPQCKGITLAGLQRLKHIVLQHGSANTPALRGLKMDRIEVFPAGLAIMIGIFKTLKIDLMQQGEGALRVGVLYDMLGRSAASDKRNETVKHFMRRYHIDTKQALRVKQLALRWFDSMVGDADPSGDIRLALGWAASLHEVGLSIAQSSYHKHTAYVLANADMPGFSREDQVRLSLLGLLHQGRLNKAQVDTLPVAKWQAVLCLRLATLFLRKRQSLRPDIVQVVANRQQHISVLLPQEWLTKHPLTQYSLALEAQEWESAGFAFSVETY